MYQFLFPLLDRFFICKESVFETQSESDIFRLLVQDVQPIFTSHLAA